MVEESKEAIEVLEYPTIKLDWPNNSKLSQISTNIKYVLLDDEYKTLHQPFHCKDYFNEIIATEYDGKSRIKYGFKSEKFPIDILNRGSFKMGIISQSTSWNGANTEINVFKNNPNYIDTIILLLNKVEKARGYNLTTIQLTISYNIIILDSDIRWMDTAVYFGLYCMLIRLAYNYNEGEEILPFLERFKNLSGVNTISTNESSSYHDAEKFIEYLCNGGEVLQPWSDLLSLDTGILHDRSGLNSYFNNKYECNLNKIIEDVENSKKESIASTNDVSSNDIIEASQP